MFTGSGDIKFEWPHESEFYWWIQIVILKPQNLTPSWSLICLIFSDRSKKNRYVGFTPIIRPEWRVCCGRSINYATRPFCRIIWNRQSVFESTTQRCSLNFQFVAAACCESVLRGIAESIDRSAMGFMRGRITVVFAPVVLILFLVQIILLTVSVHVASASIPTTLEGPSEPYTRTFDSSLRSGSEDLPMYDFQVVKKVPALYPEQITLALSTVDAMWVSWVSGK